MNMLLSPAPAEHAAEIVPLMAADDRAEMAAFGLTGEVQIALARRSWVSWSMTHDSIPMWVGGVVPVTEREGRIWLLTSPEIGRHARWVVRQRHVILSLVRSAFDVVSGACDLRHPRTVKWLLWAGFRFSPPQEISILGRMVTIQRFEWRRASCG